MKQKLQRSEQYSFTRHMNSRNTFSSHVGSNKPQNKLQKEAGVTLTPLLRGHVAMNLKNIHLDLAREELRHRNITFEAKAGIKALSKLISDHEKLITPEASYNKKFFRPQSVPAEAWDEEML